MQVAPELVGFPVNATYALQPATVRVRLQCFKEDTASLDRNQVHVQLRFGSFIGPDSTLQPILTDMPDVVRGSRVVTPAVRITRK
jgi:hypothetical protein